MKNTQDQNDTKPTNDAMKGYDPTDRDFQRTENDIDNISKSEKDEADKNTEKANTTPDKNKIN